ncbi:hypothetical protein NHX12_016912, partial [Muraenolepis orangiensis]
YKQSQQPSRSDPTTATENRRPHQPANRRTGGLTNQPTGEQEASLTSQQENRRPHQPANRRTGGLTNQPTGEQEASPTSQQENRRSF